MKQEVHFAQSGIYRWTTINKTSQCPLCALCEQSKEEVKSEVRTYDPSLRHCMACNDGGALQGRRDV